MGAITTPQRFPLPTTPIKALITLLLGVSILEVLSIADLGVLRSFVNGTLKEPELTENSKPLNLKPLNP